MTSNLQPYSPNTIELGWLIINELESVEKVSISQGRAQMLQYLQQHFPQVEWRMPVIKRTEQSHGTLEAQVGS